MQIISGHTELERSRQLPKDAPWDKRVKIEIPIISAWHMQLMWAVCMCLT